LKWTVVNSNFFFIDILFTKMPPDIGIQEFGELTLFWTVVADD
jgi:hypothetical protein